jgi:hypothetical protein
MNVWHKILTWLLIGLVILPVPTTAQDTSKSFKPEELEQIVAPIALHPDALQAQVLMASTYPLEIVEAARFVQANPNLKGDQLNQALQQYTWDDSVKSLASFPQVLAMMNEKLDWLQKLGDAFLAQQQDLMAAIQRLRARAQAEGQLKSTPEQSVVVEPAAAPAPGQTTVQVVESAPTVIRIEPTNPEVVYVPSYDPTVVYGAWPPAYPPYSPYPWGAFAAGAFTFAAGAAVGAALWGGCDWGHGDININNQRVNNFTNNVNNRTEARNRVDHYSRSGGTGAGGQGRGNWQHNPEHRRGAQYRDSATQQRFNKTGPANAQAREQFRGRTQQGGQQPSASIGDRGGQAGARSGQLGQGGGGQARQAGGGQLGQGGGQARQAGSGQVRQAGGFEGVGGGGRDAQSFSNRGNASRESLNRSAGASRPSSGGAAAARGGGGGGARAGGGGRGGGGRR